MLYRETIAVCSQIHTKHINALCGQNVELLNIKLAVQIVTTGFNMTDCQFISFADGGDKKSAEVPSVASTEGSIRNSDTDEVQVSCYLTEYGKCKRQAGTLCIVSVRREQHAAHTGGFLKALENSYLIYSVNKKEINLHQCVIISKRVN
jgi:hypothetical protein